MSSGDIVIANFELRMRNEKLSIITVHYNEFEFSEDSLKFNLNIFHR